MSQVLATSLNQEQVSWFRDTFDSLVANVEQAVLGKPDAVRLALTCLVTGGHLLIEDVPGTGKTMLAKALANTIRGTHNRIQFTPDLLPSDVTGALIYNQKTQVFEFHKGPIFATVVVADEINRASPKTQSALLEVMEEGCVTVDGTPYPVGAPFMVIATQNPVEQAGVYPLPEAQLDRFLMKTKLGYPEHDATVALLADAALRDRSEVIEPLITAPAVAQMVELAAAVHTDKSVLSYVSRLAEESRNVPEVQLGVSTRGSLALVRTAKTWAIAQGRGYVIPDDVKALAVPVLSHRVMLTPDAEFSGVDVQRVVRQIVDNVAPPTQRGGD